MASQYPVLSKLQAANDEWRNAVVQVSPNFFENGAKGQTPKVLWIGCADSRVPESVVVAAKPGDLFVHRNIAKYASRPSSSPLAAILDLMLSFAASSTPMTIQLSQCSRTPSSTSASNTVRHSSRYDHIPDIPDLVIVAGHTQCGGCVGAWSNSANPPASVPNTPLVRWLTPLIKLADSLSLGAKPQAEGVDILVSCTSCIFFPPTYRPPYQVRASVKQQVENIVQTDIIQHAWAKKKDVRVHGWVYELETGKLKDLGITRTPFWATE